MVQRPALAVAVDMGKAGDAFLAGGEQLLAGKFRRRVQIERMDGAVMVERLCGKRVQMSLVAGRNLQRRGVDFDEVALVEEPAQSRLDPVASEKKRTPVGMDIRRPPG
ncbi:hypothetical protein D3C87_1459400 [compost metagenome]